MTQERKGSIQLTGHSLSLREAKAGVPDRNLEAGTEAENVEEMLLTGLLPLTFSAPFLIQPWSTCPEVITPIAGWTLLW